MKPDTLEYIKFIYQESWDDPMYGPEVQQSAKDFEAGIAFQRNKEHLSKRELIAAMAMQGMLSNSSLSQGVHQATLSEWAVLYTNSLITAL